MELMHPALKASRENVCRSAFVQFLVTALESKECCLSTERNRRVRDSDRFSLAGDGTPAFSPVWRRRALSSSCQTNFRMTATTLPTTSASRSRSCSRR